MKRVCTISFLLLALVLPSAHAIAAPRTDPALPRSDPPHHWRLITKDDATTTSHCIGNTNTPLCAVETAMACRYRYQRTLSDHRLCELSMTPELAKGVWGPLYLAPPPVRYRVLSARFARRDAEPLPDGMRYGSWILAGDALVIIKQVECRGQHDCRSEGEPPYTYIVRRFAAGWRVVEWDIPPW